MPSSPVAQEMLKPIAALQEKAWEALEAIEDEPWRNSALAAYAFDETYAARIRNPLARAEAYDNILGEIKDCPAVRVSALLAKATEAATEALTTSGITQDHLVGFMYQLAIKTENQALAQSIPDERRRNGALGEIIIKQAAANTDPTLVLEAPDPNYQGRAVYAVVEQTGNVALARQIKDPCWRARALAAASTRVTDGGKKQELQQEALELGMTLEPSFWYESIAEQKLEYIVGLMKDKRVAQRLLDDPRVTARMLSKIAQNTNDPELALQIPENTQEASYYRDETLKWLAYINKRPGLAAHISNPETRSIVYRWLYDTTVNPRPEEPGSED